MSCDSLDAHGGNHLRVVSIARRRLVVLRPVQIAVQHPPGLRFNRPQAISCLATQVFDHPNTIPFVVSIARRRLVVLRLRWSRWQRCRFGSFNRPQAISCLATGGGAQPFRPAATKVSIARRRLVVLRRYVEVSYTFTETVVSIARRRLVVLRRQSRRVY